MEYVDCASFLITKTVDCPGSVWIQRHLQAAVDFLSVDVEGVELMVVSSMIIAPMTLSQGFACAGFEIN